MTAIRKSTTAHRSADEGKASGDGPDRTGSAAAEPAPARASDSAGYRLATVLDLLASCIEADTFQQAAGALCNELASRLGCNRVSLGTLRDGRMQLVAISNSAVIDHRTNLACDLRCAMAEATDQGATVSVGRAGNPHPLSQAHQALARRHGSPHIVSLPLSGKSRLFGALTLERDGLVPFDDAAMAVTESLAAVAGPLLELKQRDDRSVFRHARDTTRRLLAGALGPRHPVARLLIVLGALVVLWLATASGPLRITAPARLEGSIQRALVAPQDGFVAEARARAGDLVKTGDLIASLESRDLVLERARLVSELDQLKKQYRSALAVHDRAESAILNARMDQTEARVELLDAQIDRTRLEASIDGVVIAGDLSQLLGTPVARGDVLFEIAPLDGYRVVIEVDERDIGAVRADQTGRLALEGLSGDTLAIAIDRITPVSVPRDGRNFFRVEARVESPAGHLRPGMSGYARIDAGEGRLIQVWTRRAIGWLRLKVWTLRP